MLYIDRTKHRVIIFKSMSNEKGSNESYSTTWRQRITPKGDLIGVGHFITGIYRYDKRRLQEKQYQRLMNVIHGSRN